MILDTRMPYFFKLYWNACRAFNNVQNYIQLQEYDMRITDLDRGFVSLCDLHNFVLVTWLQIGGGLLMTGKHSLLSGK